MSKVPEMFGSMVFNDKKMQERLPKSTYRALKKTIQDGEPLDISVANVVAAAMKDWAIEMGATHYTHWFQPMTGVTAEKHDSFIQPHGDGVIMEFSGKELIKGEPDASSFPSGGIRATFEARGYTTWDPTSPAFVRDGSLYIPTAFCSYTGEVLDKKTPLLRSMERMSTEAVKILHLLGKTDVTRVTTTVGPEQEYFLIDKELYDQREDLKLTGRTLFGAKAPKGQELDDHYFGAIKTRVAAYMKDIDEELWKLGVLAKTKHNEVAPSQHELAPIFTTSNIANDHNELTMEIMQKTAEKHGLVCLLHEKPFAGVNGSGKHNNWSLSTNLGENLLSPGKHPENNVTFQLFLAAVVKAVDEYQDLLRATVASAGNDHRLGANEAPPAIMSVYLGDDLGEMVQAIIDGEDYVSHGKERMETGVEVLADFKKDTSDRNRTSPFAFTGNKFEFRALGSALNIGCPNYMLNTMVAEELSQFYVELKGAENINIAVRSLVRNVLTEHQRIIFNGDNYADEWVEEAQKRGLYNLKSL
uniref:glutamine synthetase III family protein n=1 Tax=uncultured Ruminococcus sp. TaxID=165186 RepID=UPI0029312CA5